MSHLVVIGAGIVGLNCALSAQRRGWRVTLIDRDFEGDRASHGNAGGLAVSECVPLSLAGLGLRPLRWLVDPLGPLAIRPAHAPRLLPWYRALRKISQKGNFARIGDALAALNQHALDPFMAMLAELGLSGDLHRNGALSVYETDGAFLRDQPSWQFRRERGVRWREVGREELHALEPGLAPVFARAIMIEDWAHIDDPRRIVDRLRHYLAGHGARLVTGEATALVMAEDGGAGARLADGTVVRGDRVLVAAGAWAARLARTVGDVALLESERGYNTTLPHSAHRLSREVLFAEAMFVATPLSVGLRIGGAAEFAGLQAPANYRRSDALLALSRRYITSLDERDNHKWMGHRPATPDSLPVIGRSPHSPRVLYAFGHGHLGLTQSAITGELIGDLLDDRPTAIDLSPYGIDRFRRGGAHQAARPVPAPANHGRTRDAAIRQQEPAARTGSTP
ncbi:FAD-binding oxidoreductase [Komagataeibacter sp. FNDCF1]|uniref:NAD(P)/FAD-dependent oxidoreductase n=1 Tax=Komagataeibacter sp. FNDCF1 TaxID=2878681 RepID=UPI001E448CFB|nr:FAD-binding oxidoreductase [Komagataeibacter sp. FNDCF1]MCE2563595.1 FAD-binding oxidoreductase [Komagataeibacter sp. FNDCF1]